MVSRVTVPQTSLYVICEHIQCRAETETSGNFRSILTKLGTVGKGRRTRSVGNETAEQNGANEIWKLRGPRPRICPPHVKLQRNAQDGVQAHDWWGWSPITICNTRVGRSTSHSNCYLRQVPIYCPCFVRASQGCTKYGSRQ